MSEIEDTPPNVTKLPVQFKTPMPADRTLLSPFEVQRGGGCSHYLTGYIVDPTLAEVECGGCGAKLNPMWVLTRLATEDRRMAEAQARYQDEQRRLRERSRTKCRSCGAMTPISRA
ncbi:hypothetical protein [Caulobacter sp. S45]|uniref:hypothetical protein n=1 Tax=Caulobacter sp. S45 TaxID=1641861 RepID=UPI001577190B|nr:hypothetical protein [Caulobacter sp. S45]